MIAWLNGVVRTKGIDSVVLDVNGVGYRLLVSLRTLERMPSVGEDCQLSVHTNVREDAIQLFGFLNDGERSVFLQLLSVSGVGPKTALSALSLYPADELRSIVVDGDLTRLCRVSGVGKKTAQRVILELGEKLMGIDIEGSPALGGKSQMLDDLRLALADLGYTSKQAEKLTESLAPKAKQGASLEELLKEALGLVRS
ncbi:MAG: Holliday junction DNA helicase RuvA [Bradymonadia bacterium]|jgi:Holliday junction DNA helicase RuvA